MTALLAGIFFLSGAAGLVFETLWFRQAGLAFGNSFWASSLVLSSFMAGLGLGNALIARVGSKLREPLRAYAALEVAIGVSGAALVFGLPGLTSALAGLLRPFLDDPWLLNPLRLGVGFVLLALPATAMYNHEFDCPHRPDNSSLSSSLAGRKSRWKECSRAVNFVCLHCSTNLIRWRALSSKRRST